jgi:hypothetical protein
MSSGHEWAKYQGSLNIIPLGSYDCLIGMDWLDQHHVVLEFHHNEFTFLDEEGNPRTVQGIPTLEFIV